MLVIETTANTRKGSEKNIMSKRASHHSNKVYLHTDPLSLLHLCSSCECCFYPSFTLMQKAAGIDFVTLFVPAAVYREIALDVRKVFSPHTHTPVAKVSSHMMNLFGHDIWSQNLTFQEKVLISSILINCVICVYSLIKHLQKETGHLTNLLSGFDLGSWTKARFTLHAEVAWRKHSMPIERWHISHCLLSAVLHSRSVLCVSFAALGLSLQYILQHAQLSMVKM